MNSEVSTAEHSCARAHTHTHTHIETLTIHTYIHTHSHTPTHTTIYVAESFGLPNNYFCASSYETLQSGFWPVDVGKMIFTYIFIGFALR